MVKSKLKENSLHDIREDGSSYMNSNENYGTEKRQSLVDYSQYDVMPLTPELDKLKSE